MFKPQGVIYLTLVFVLLSWNCSGPDSDLPLLTAEMPLHLEEHIDDAGIEGSKVSEEIFAPVEWDFSEPQPDWKPAKSILEQRDAVKPVRVDDSLRLPLTEATRHPQSSYLGATIYVELPDWNLEDWAYVDITARTQDPMNRVGLYFNYTEKDSFQGNLPFYSIGDRTPLITDGTVQTYRLSLDYPNMRRWKGPWTHLGIWFNTRPDEEEVTLDVLSVRVVPKEHIYSDAPVGVRVDKREEAHRHTLYTHAPGRIEYRVRIPEAGRLDFGLGVLREKVPVTFRISASQQKEQEVTLFEEIYANTGEWAQRSVDLSAMARKTVTIALEAEAEQPGSVALWAAPTLTGTRTTEKPNVIFYVIDGGSPDHMSVYGYNRRTTPNLERLAAEGVLFENVYSNSTWSGVSTPSFMTSLHISVMGGYRDWVGGAGLMLPDQAVTMAQHMHRSGYQTAVFTDNVYAGAATGLDRDGVDVLRDTYILENPSSPAPKEIHKDYWRWRAAYPAEPYWVHFQPFDAHWPFETSSAGLYVNPELRERNAEWESKLREVAGGVAARLSRSEALAKAGIDPDMLFYARCGLYDEGMAHADYMLGRLVQRLKEAGEWEHTILIIAADHGSGAVGLGDRDPTVTDYDPMFRRWATRVPLLIFWPGHIAGGQRFSQTVSMIDVLPTVLDLVGLPMPEIMQGQSLAPLLFGEEGWEPRPVILDNFEVDRETGELSGIIEVVDRRWGASLEINPDPDADTFPRSRRTVPLLLYDLWNDPYTQHSLHEEHPDLVDKYTKFLKAQFEAHQNLSKLFTTSGRIALTPEQLERLRALGYID